MCRHALSLLTHVHQLLRVAVQLAEQVGADDGSNYRDHRIRHPVQLVPGTAMAHSMKHCRRVHQSGSGEGAEDCLGQDGVRPGAYGRRDALACSTRPELRHHQAGRHTSPNSCPPVKDGCGLAGPPAPEVRITVPLVNAKRCGDPAA